MYVPEHFAERDPAVLHGWMRRHAFAVLVTVRDGAFEASHVPLWLDAERGPLGTLYGHVARGNPHGLCFDGRTRGLAVFSGPHAYVSPRWFERPSVPTWNYVAVHAEGVLHPVTEPAALLRTLERLTETHDGLGGFGAISEELVARLSRGILAFELPIETLTGKCKLSQNKTAADRAGMAAALEAHGGENERAIAALVREGLAP